MMARSKWRIVKAHGMWRLIPPVPDGVFYTFWGFEDAVRCFIIRTEGRL